MKNTILFLHIFFLLFFIKLMSLSFPFFHFDEVSNFRSRIQPETGIDDKK